MKFKVTRKDQDIIASVMVFKEKWWLWVIEIKNLIWYGVPILLLGILTISYLTFHRPQHQKDYFSAARSYEQWAQGDEAQFDQLEQMLKQHPELHSRYDGPIVTQLLAKNQMSVAKDYAQNTLTRTDGLAPAYNQFAKATIAICENQMADALTISYQLDEQLDPEANKVLISYNLLRIAALESKVGNPEKEKAALQRLQEFIDQNKEDHDMHLFLQHFQAGQVGLAEYISSRL